MTALTHEQNEWINSGFRLLHFLSERPELIPTYEGVTVHATTIGPAKFAEQLRRLGSAEKYATDLFIGARRSFGPHEVVVCESRQAVCERVEVGLREIEEEVAPDTVPEDARVISEAPRRLVVRRLVPQYELRCPESLLADPS